MIIQVNDKLQSGDIGIVLKGKETAKSCITTSKWNVEYRDGIKSKGDKIGMPCTHSTVI